MMRNFLFLLQLLLTLLAMAATTTKHPVVGVLTKPVSEADPTKGSFVGSTIVRWPQSAGLRVVPVPFDLPFDQLDVLLSKLNGVVFTGGGLELRRGLRYFETARHIFDRSLEWQKTDPFPILGVCMGFQLLHILVANNESCLTANAFDSSGLPLPLEFTLLAAKSSMFGTAPTELMTALATRNLTLNDHVCGVEPVAYRTWPELGDFFSVLSNNHDRRGKEFISTVEAKHHAIWATQWHPECASWLWVDSLGTDHSPDAVWASNHIIRPFVEAARRNTHRFQTEVEEVSSLIDKLPTKFDDRDGTTTWFFPPSK